MSSIIADVTDALRDAYPAGRSADELAHALNLTAKQVYSAVYSKRRSNPDHPIASVVNKGDGKAYLIYVPLPVKAFPSEGTESAAFNETPADVKTNPDAAIEYADTQPRRGTVGLWPPVDAELMAAAKGNEAVGSFRLKMAINLDELILQDGDKDVWLATRL